ncbi:MAG: polysaccharide biosynthesis protein [Treponema sp.]|nr:polysaccharide biosynthesis protein [Treponema sp.]
MSSKSISKSVVWQLAGKLALQGLAFFTAPVFTRLLTTADYGYVSLYTSWCSIISIFVAMEVAGSIGNARIKYEGINIYEYLSSILTLTLIPFGVFLGIALIFNSSLAPLLSLRRDLIVLVVLNAYASFLISFLISKLDAYKQVEKSALISFFQSLIIIVISIIFVVRSKDNRAFIKIYSQALPTILIGLSVFMIIYSKGRCFWKSEYNKFCIGLALPLIGHSIAGLVFTQCDKLMLRRIQNESELGIYSITYTLCNLLLIIYAAFNNAWVPFYYDFKRQGKTEEILLHTKRYLKFFTLICVGFLLLSIDVFKLLTPETYWTGMNAIPLFVLSIYFNYLYLFPANFEFYNCMTKLVPIGTISSAIINVIMNALLIPRYSIYGAVAGSLISHIVLFGIHEVFAKFVVKKNYEYRIKMFIPGTVVLIIFSVAFYFLKDLWIVRWLLVVCIAGYLIYGIIRNKSIF